MPAEGRAGDGELGQNNASSATEPSPETPSALGFSKAEGMPYALYDIIFKSGNPDFCTRELKRNRFFFSEKGNSDVGKLLLADGAPSFCSRLPFSGLLGKLFHTV